MEEYITIRRDTYRIPVRYGVITQYADERILPTHDALYESPFDVDMDQLQNNALDVGTPLVILYETNDGRWCYGRSPASGGWVETKYIAFCSRSHLRSYLNYTTRAVATIPKADIYRDAALKTHYDYIKMGSSVPLIDATDSLIQVRIPLRSSNGDLIDGHGYMRRDAAHIGYLPYTARTIIEQAFKMLNQPYGWGDMYGEQDCSRFIQEIFATVGMAMPRNSSGQAQVGGEWALFDDSTSEAARKASIASATAGATLLYMNGHIMLYVGMIDKAPYVIHAAWAYRELTDDNTTRVRKVNRIIVSDLELGKGSQRRSYLERLISVRDIR